MTARWHTKVAAAAATGALVTLAACSGSDSPAGASEPTRSTSPGSPQSSAPTGGSEAEPRWQLERHISSLDAFGDAGTGFVLATALETVGLDDEAKVRWEVPEKDEKSVANEAVLSGTTVIRTRTTYLNGGSMRLRVLDAETGRQLWRARASPEAVIADAVYLRHCRATACDLERRDLRTGRVQWRRGLEQGPDFLEVNGTTLVITSYPFGTDRTQDPYGERSRTRAFDTRTGQPLGHDRLGNEFRLVGPLLVETGYRGSVGERCAVTLTARDLRGTEKWRRTLDWTRSAQSREQDRDCAADFSVDALAGQRVAVRAATRWTQVLARGTGRTQWRLGPKRKVVFSDGTIDVVRDSRDGSHQGLDRATHRQVWQVRGEGGYVDEAGKYLVVERDQPDDRQGFALYSVRDGQFVFSTRGNLLAHGSGWVASADARRVMLWDAGPGVAAQRSLGP